MHGIINIYKPTNISSNYCLTLLKKQLYIKKLGHLGTLDPLACGVLPVMVNKGTKLFDFYLNKDKTYRAIFTFGLETDTLDSEGKIVKTSNKIPSIDEINLAINSVIGEIDQIPPAYSAKNINGIRAYNLARKGNEVNLKPKRVKINYFKLITQINFNSFLFEINCSSGTYIRSLARDLGVLTKSCAYMSALIRTDSGNFNILNSTSVKDLTKENFSDKLIKLDDLLNMLNRIDLNASYYKQITNGMSVRVKIENSKLNVVYCKNQLIGIGEVSNYILKIKTNLQS